MKALIYRPDSDEFLLQNVPEPDAHGFNVKIRVIATGLNPVDSKVNYWYPNVPDQASHFVGGLDVAGEIIAVGEDVTHWQPGDRVLYHGNMFRPSGGFAEYALHDSRTLIKLPAVDPVEAAATPCAGWTALHALKSKLNIERRSSILIAGGAGGIGTFAIQLAKLHGVKAIIATASAAKHSYLQSLGATHTIDYHKDDIPNTVRDITRNQGVEVALDAVGGENDILCANSLGFEGELCGLVSTLRPERYKAPFNLGLSFHQLSLGAAHTHNPHLLLELGTSFSRLLEDRKISCPKIETVDFSGLGDGLLALRKKKTSGKIVFTP
jgi:NADPH:quinone reductase-like Zn-dependent oxidoreductase